MCIRDRYTLGFASAAVHPSSGAIRAAHGTENYKYTAYLSTSEVNAIQFKFASGNIASGEITMFGIVNS